jgi:WD40 repeat protein
MTADRANAEDPFTGLLVACDEALAAGDEASVRASASTVPAELRARLDRGLACLKLLHAVLPGRPPSDAPADPGGGRLGRFHLLRPLGRGAFGVVWLAHDPDLRREVALKVPRAEALADPDLRDRFVREARAAAGLDHPNIIPVHEAGEAGPVCYLASAYCPGPSLAGWLRGRAEPVPIRQATALVAALAGAVQHAHARGVVHRDLKPANVLLAPLPGDGPDPDGLGFVPRVTDFGLAKFLTGADSHLTQTGAVLGTPAYMAPEQGGNSAAVGPAADVYALGVILYELLTGRAPFVADTPLETLLLARSEEPVPPGRIRLGLPRDLESVCLKCLAKEPGRRYASAAQLADELRLFLDSRPLRHTRRVTAAERAWRWCRRNPAVAGLLAAVWVSVLAGAGTAGYFAVKADRRADEADHFAGEYRREADRATAHMHEANRRLYVSDVRQVGTAYRESRLDHARELLGRQRPEHTAGVDLRGFEWYFWDRLCHSELATLTGHDGPINAVSFSPDGGRLATAGWDSTARVWDLSGGSAPVVFRVPVGHVNAVAFSPDGSRVASACGGDNTLRIWDPATGREERVIPHPRSVNQVAYRPDGRKLATASGADVFVWDAGGGKELHLPGEGDNYFWRVAFSPDGRMAVYGGRHGVVRVRHLDTGSDVLTVTVAGRVQAVAFGPDGARVAAGDAGGKVTVWTLRDRKVETVFAAGAPVRSIAFSPAGSRVAANGLKTVRVWDRGEVREYKGHVSDVSAVGFSPDGRRLAAAADDGTVRVWDATAAVGPLRINTGHTSLTAAITPDGRLVSAGQAGEVRVWDLETARPVSSVNVGAAGIVGSAFDPGAGRLAAAGPDKLVRVWDLAGRGEPVVLRGHEDTPRCVAFRPDGRRLASGGVDRTVRVWDLAGGGAPRVLAGHDGWTTCLAFSPDGTRLASGGSDRLVLVRDAGGGEPLILRGHSDSVLGVAFSPDGSLVASAGGDGTVRVWDGASGRERFVLRGHSGSVERVAFSPDGRRLASGGWDGTVKLWDLASGQEMLSISAVEMSRMTSLGFSPDGTRLMVVRDAGVITILDARPWGPDVRQELRSWFAFRGRE